MLVHVVRDRLVLVLWKSVPLLISYDVICVETLPLNNFVRFSPIGHFIIDGACPGDGLRACQIWSQTIKSWQSY